MFQIQKVKIEGFKCIGSIETELRPFNVLIGPNDSGKTSFMEAIYLLAEMANSKQVNDFLRDPLLWDKGRKIHKQGKVLNQEIIINLTLTLNGHSNSSYSIAMNPNHAYSIYEITKEILKAGALECTLSKDANKQYTLSKNGHPMSTFGQEWSILTYGHKEIKKLTALFGKMGFFHFNANSPAVDSRPYSDNESHKLESDGYRLPSLLAGWALTDRSRIISIEEDLKKISKGMVKSISTPPITKHVYSGGKPVEETFYGLEFITGTGLNVPAKQMSTGILYTLCILSLVHHPEPPGIIFLEEPENSVHPSRLKEIVDYLRMLSSRKNGPTVQIVMATHSPYLLDHCSPEEVLVFERDPKDHLTKIFVTNHRAMKERNRTLSIGETWGSYGEKGLVESLSGQKKVKKRRS